MESRFLVFFILYVKEDCQARKLNTEDAVDRSKWTKLIRDVRWPGWVWVGECFFWYRPPRVVPDQRPLNGCVCVCYFKYTEQLQLLKRVLLQASAVDGERKPKLTNKKRKLGDGKQKLKLARPIRPKVAAHALTPPSTVCFTCGEDSGGETARCARGQCGKMYHIACLNLTDKPPGYIRLVFLTENYCRTRIFRVHLIFAIRVASRN